MSYIVQTEGLTKRYGAKTVVSNLDMNISKGDIYGFIGRNGAGKTTTMKMLLGTAAKTSGKIRLFESDDLDKMRFKIGSLIEAPGLYKNFSAYENMKRFSILFGGNDKKIKEILEFVGLSKVGNKRAGAFSLGMKQRLGIALAMLGDPELLILDEPINGLDPAGIKEIRDIILKLNKEREITVLVSSHLLDELARITTRYGIINEGVLIEEITAEDLKNRCKQYTRLVVDKPEEATRLIRERAPEMEIKNEKGEIHIYGNVTTATLNAFLVKSGIAVSELASARDEFEDYFIKRLGV